MKTGYIYGVDKYHFFHSDFNYLVMKGLYVTG